MAFDVLDCGCARESLGIYRVRRLDYAAYESVSVFPSPFVNRLAETNLFAFFYVFILLPRSGVGSV